MDNIIYKDNKAYYKRNCPHCNQEFLFHMEEGERRVHGACRSCGKIFEMIVPGLKRQCAFCGFKLLESDKICPNCGLEVKR